ncbi:SPX domain-domain-containing protein [Kockovaella imperatae]|uniref:SPX domain-domain-containing protein n=1 Tax=Kockovaella imperatae TaxID=4999 RepID=A0A1Y1URJ9_9TREE|nr:SPX domain-domain-containing protein [Kockovaella imperatae]ORX40589.1 SPX domain-domain-containing protein [Kockovaella imperatae]
MKFGQYLKDHLTPEWKRAYIDYSACKKAIKVVKKRLDQAREGQRDHTAGEGAQEDGDDREASSDLDDEDHGPSKPRRTKTVSSTWSARSPRGTIGSGRTARTPGSALRQVDSRGRSGGSNAVSPQAIPRRPSPPPPLDLGESSYPKSSEIQQAGPDTPRGALGRRAATISDAPAQIIHASSSSSPDEAGDQDNDPDMSDSGRILTSPSKTKMKSATFSPRFHKSPRIFQRSGPTHSPKSSRGNESPQVSGRGGRSIRSLALQSPKAASVVAPTFEDLYKGLEEDERAFFDLLDHELNKVEQFFTARQKEAQDRFKELKDQLTTLGEHRKRYHELYPNGLPGVLLPPQQVQSLSRAANKLHLRIPFTHDADHHVAKTDGEGNSTTPKAVHDKTNGISGDPSGNATAENGRGVALGEFDTYNPERYQHYKRELRAASLDFYRHLERIKNYRILNLTGFRKALKKFEKTTRIHCMDMYTDERISKESFAQGDVVEKLLDQMEKLYSEHFEHGDSKKARDRLRRQTDVQTHHTSVFRAGMMIGLAMPAVIFALVIARKPETKVAIPPRDELLQVYGALFMPVMFGMLFQLNLDAFVSARINYEVGSAVRRAPY